MQGSLVDPINLGKAGVWDHNTAPLNYYFTKAERFHFALIQNTSLCVPIRASQRVVLLGLP